MLVVKVERPDESGVSRREKVIRGQLLDEEPGKDAADSDQRAQRVNYVEEPEASLSKRGNHDDEDVEHLHRDHRKRSPPEVGRVLLDPLRQENWQKNEKADRDEGRRENDPVPLVPDDEVDVLLGDVCIPD